MKTAAIICEYNPFHSGHKHQIDEIRRQFGEDTRIIAIMSGNYTQRASLAFAPKHSRAAWALECGVNLVLELPFPYSMASAELFALAGVRIAERLGVIDILSFGSESGDIDALYNIARNMANENYEAELSRLMNDDSLVSLGYPRLCEIAYASLFGDNKTDITAPNNILAIEYIKAIIRTQSAIVPHTIARVGAGYNDAMIDSAVHQSASAIRAAVFSGDESAFSHLPECVARDLREKIVSGLLPVDEEALSPALISHFLLNNAPVHDIHDAQGGLYNRIAAKSREATSISSLYELSQTKKYTTARIRRAIWFSFFGVTSSDVKDAPLFTRVLAADEIGRKALKEIKKINGISVITKPSDDQGLSPKAKKIKLLSDRADLVFQLALPKKAPPADALRATPLVKK